MATKRTFNKAALTPFFKRKVETAEWMLKHFEPIKAASGHYERSGIYKDPIRNAYLRIYIGRKVKGIGAGRVNECSIRYSEDYHPEFKGNALTAADLKVYYADRKKAEGKEEVPND